MALVFRTFRNPDPPQILRLWNAGLTSRSAAFLQSTQALEVHVFSKPYFDRKGMQIAEENGQIIGFAHAGFGPDDSGMKLNYRHGLISLMVVHPKYQRLGIGRELLRRAEAYLQEKGAATIQAGGMKPLNPFYWGLYGGSELPGLLLSDVGADFFFQSNGYRLKDSLHVYQRQMDGPVIILDSRFIKLKRKYEVRVMPRPISKRWFDECIYAPLEMLHFQLQEVATGQPLAQARMWDMDPFAWRWHQPAAGVIDIEVRPSARRLGLGKYLMFQVLRYIQEQFYSLVEIQVSASNQAGIQLLQTIGFRQVDEGRVYQLERAPVP